MADPMHDAIKNLIDMFVESKDADRKKTIEECINACGYRVLYYNITNPVAVNTSDIITPHLNVGDMK